MTSPAQLQPTPHTDNPEIRVLDIGGGTDERFDSSSVLDNELREKSIASLMGTRAVRLAQANPNMSVTVFDPEISSSAAEVSAKVGNVTFEEGQVDAEHSLPYEDGSMDIVEANHLFRPLQPMMLDNDKLKLKDLSALIDTLNGQMHTLENGGSLVMHELPPRPEDREKQIEELRKRIESIKRQHDEVQLPDRVQKHGTQEDFADYLTVITEAGRVLKPGGKLKLAEKSGTIETIKRLLSAEEEFDSEILEKAGLKFAALEPNDDEFRSAYADRAERQAEDLESEDAQKSGKSRPMLLILEKLAEARN